MTTDLAGKVVLINVASGGIRSALARHSTGQTLVVAGGTEGRLIWQPDEIDPTAA